jgi:hypothetical protein
MESELTRVDRAILDAIHHAADADGNASSLFDLAVRRAGVDYAWAHYRLRGLELLGYVRVDRCRGLPLVIHLIDRDRIT